MTLVRPGAAHKRGTARCTCGRTCRGRAGRPAPGPPGVIAPFGGWLWRRASSGSAGSARGRGSPRPSAGTARRRAAPQPHRRRGPTAILGLRDHPTQAFVEVIFALLQAGAPLDSIMKNEKAEFILRVFEPIRRGPGMVIQNEHCSRARSSSQISAGPVAPGLRIENRRAKTCCGCAV